MPLNPGNRAPRLSRVQRVDQTVHTTWFRSGAALALYVAAVLLAGGDVMAGLAVASAFVAGVVLP